MSLLPEYQLPIGDSRLPTAWFTLRPHKLQSKLWRTDSKFPVVVAGRGSGKTEEARRYITRWLPVLKPWPDPKYFYGLPTYNQAKRVVWPQLEALIPKAWLVKNGANRSELTFTTKFGSTLYIVGMDKPARIEGIQVDGGILDECSDQKPETFTRTILPMLTHRNGFCWQIGVPKRNGPGAIQFRQNYEKGERGEEGFESYTWASNTILSPEQLAKVLAILDVKDALEQLGGIWVEASGMVYHAYSDTRNLSDLAVYRPDLPIGVGSDFNVDPMAWVLFHVIDHKMYIFDEVYIKDTNTQATLNNICDGYTDGKGVKHVGYKDHKNGWHFYGDSSARSRQTSAATTDYLQILNDPRFFNKRTGEPQKVHYDLSHPPIVDRYASVNALLYNALNQVRLFIHPKCKNLRTDLEQRTYKEGTREPDNSDLNAGHITDALGYAIYKLFPIRYEIAPASQIHLGTG